MDDQTPTGQRLVETRLLQRLKAGPKDSATINGDPALVEAVDTLTLAECIREVGGQYVITPRGCNLLESLEMTIRG